MGVGNFWTRNGLACRRRRRRFGEICSRCDLANSTDPTSCRTRRRHGLPGGRCYRRQSVDCRQSRQRDLAHCGFRSPLGAAINRTDVAVVRCGDAKRRHRCSGWRTWRRGAYRRWRPPLGHCTSQGETVGPSRCPCHSENHSTWNSGPGQCGIGV